MKIEVKGLDRLLHGFERLGRSDEAEKTVEKSLHEAAIGTQAKAKEDCPADTGQLRGSILLRKIKGGYRVGAYVKHGVYVEFGTGTLGNPSVPHTTKKYWRYKDDKGNWHTSHGMKPRPFLQPAFNEYKAKLPEIVKIKLARSLKEAMRNG